MRSRESIACDVDRGIAIYAEQARLKAELESIEARLTADALARPEEHAPLEQAAREGKKWLAAGTAGALPVVFSADTLVKTFEQGGKLHLALATHFPCAALSEEGHAQWTQLFTRWSGYERAEEDGLKFRALAEQVLGAEAAPAFITALKAVDKHGIPKSITKLLWRDAAATAKMEEIAP